MEHGTTVQLTVAFVLVFGLLVFLKLLAPHMGITFSIPFLDPVLEGFIRGLRSLADFTARFSPI